MKNIIQVSTLLFFVFFLTTDSSAQKAKATATFWVGGVCEMCEKRIEKTMDTKGIISADYNLDKHELTLVYNPKKINEDRIHQMLNAVGHDTTKSMASEEEYGKIHGCCKYREHEHNH